MIILQKTLLVLTKQIQISKTQHLESAISVKGLLTSVQCKSFIDISCFNKLFILIKSLNRDINQSNDRKMWTLNALFNNNRSLDLPRT